MTKITEKVGVELDALQRLAARFGGFSPHAVLVLLKAAAALFCLAVFFQLGASAHVGSALQPLDEAVLRWVGGLRSPDYDFFILDLSSLGSMAVVTMICVVSSVLFLFVRDPAAAIHLVLVTWGGYKIIYWSKTLFDRPRPDLIPKLIEVGGKSFPSGHAVTTSAVYLTLAILCLRHFKGTAPRVALFALAGTVVLAVCFSRVYMGVHWPSDMLSGAFLGSAWALFMGALFSKQHFFRKKNAPASR